MRDGKAKPLPTVERLRELFSYDPETGIVTRNIAAPKIPAGAAVGTLNSAGALICRADYQIVYVHRVAWALFYGEEPPPIIDHINGTRSDNRIANLREATAQQNTQNRRASKFSKSKIKGAHWSSLEKKWRSSIKIDGKFHHLGWFRNCDDAAAAYRAAEIKFFGEFARAD